MCELETRVYIVCGVVCEKKKKKKKMNRLEDKIVNEKQNRRECNRSKESRQELIDKSVTKSRKNRRTRAK